LNLKMIYLTITRPESVLTGRTNQDLENANTTH
jgi:hypothetical protein